MNKRAVDIDIPDGIYPVFLVYCGKEKLQLSELIFGGKDYESLGRLSEGH